MEEIKKITETADALQLEILDKSWLNKAYSASDKYKYVIV